MKNTDKYRFAVTNRQTDGEMADTVTERGSGTYRRQGDRCFLKYTSDAATVLIKATPDEITVTRRGDAVSAIRYMAGRRTYFEYKTPYGSIAMSVYTESADLCTADTGGRIRLKYTLSTGEEELSNDMEIKWEVNT